MTTHDDPLNSNLPEDDTTDAGTATDSPQWSDEAPKGGRTVLNRILKDGAKVPLFLGQTLVKSLRDLGYNSTTSAVCEHVDNAIQWGADEVRVYFNETGKGTSYRIDVMVFDNGQGMAPHVLKVATAFGGSMVYESRTGIGRYGMGMKAAALSMSPVLEIYSWQEPGAIYGSTIDVEDIGGNRSNLIEISDPELTNELSSEIANILTRPMAFPKNPQDTQDIFAESADELRERLGTSGTIIYMPNCDRLTYRKARTLVDHATKEMSRIYRRQIEKGLRLYINNRLVEAFDPTYWMTSARHTRVEGPTEKQSRLIKSWVIDIPVSEELQRTAKCTVRLYMLPFEDWSNLPRKVLKNDLHLFDGSIVSFVRNDRELEIGASYRGLSISRHGDNNWLRLLIDFSGELDEAFGVAANKQGVRPKDYVFTTIREVIGEELATLRQYIKKMKAEQTAGRTGSKVSKADRVATDTDALQGKPLLAPAPETEEERVALERNLRGLAVGLKREGETDEEAYERINQSTYITVFKHDEYWPFYHCEFKFGKVILTINTAHSFFHKMWEPLSAVAKAVDAADERDNDVDGVHIEPDVARECADALVSLQLLLLSLGRTQSQLTVQDNSDDLRKLFEKLRREWSSNLETQLTAK